MDKLQERMQKGRNGNAILFCGAGLTADCLNFDDNSTIGVTSRLLHMLNEELKKTGHKYGYKDIKNAARKFKEKIGNYALMTLLKNRFTLQSVSAAIADIVRYPWTSIYTINYDNGLELALYDARKKCVPINNLDSPNQVSSGTPVIHLHGRAETWTPENFEQSCILDEESYRILPGMKTFSPRLRIDFERAEIVVFIGFSATDFHLGNIFFDVSGLKEKAFFINPSSAEPDLDEQAAQEGFGTPLYIGREAFAQCVTELIKKEAPQEPALASFKRFQPPPPSENVPSVGEIEDLFVWGKVVQEHLRRDHDLSKSDYHVLRHEMSELQNHLKTAGAVVLVHGDICDGKSLIIQGSMNGLIGSRPIFQLQETYLDLLKETSSILSYYPNAILVVENCFSLHEDRLKGLAQQVVVGDGSLVLSARNVSTESEQIKLKKIKEVAPHLKQIKIGPLEETEANNLIVLIDQIAGWRDFQSLSLSQRQQFIVKECNNSIPGVLLRLLNSKYVKDRYREEYNKIIYSTPQDEEMVIATLLISNIGHDTRSSFISDIFKKDFSSVLRYISDQSDGLQLVRVERGGSVRTPPSIGVRNLLRGVIEDRKIVEATINILEEMAINYYRNNWEQHIFSQLMRYSILSSVVTDNAEINRFFDHISKIESFRRTPLFWLQWHMAMCAQEQWPNAEKYLSMGYTAADNYDERHDGSFNRKQLNDRKAKFLAKRAISLNRSGTELFRDMKEALDICDRLLHDPILTHHPFETLRDIVKAFHELGNTIPDQFQPILNTRLENTKDQAKRMLDNVAEGYQRSHAARVIREIEVM